MATFVTLRDACGDRTATTLVNVERIENVYRHMTDEEFGYDDTVVTLHTGQSVLVIETPAEVELALRGACWQPGGETCREGK